jgi:CheY-like chemotaxis protein
VNPPIRILLVEDHASTNAVLTRLLSGECTVYPAVTAAKALELARSQPVDLVIADIGLPDMDGWELVRQVREIQPEVHAIALTGVDYTEDPHRFSAAGFDMHIAKPADIGKLKSAIRTLIPDRS